MVGRSRAAEREKQEVWGNAETAAEEPKASKETLQTLETREFQHAARSLEPRIADSPRTRALMLALVRI